MKGRIPLEMLYVVDIVHISNTSGSCPGPVLLAEMTTRLMGLLPLNGILQPTFTHLAPEMKIKTLTGGSGSTIQDSVYNN